MTVREYLSNLQNNLGILLDWFLDGARLLGNFQWLDFTMPQVLLTGFFFWVLYLAVREETDGNWDYSDNNINDAGHLNAKNLVELNFKFFLTFLFNLFCGFVVIVMAFVLLFDVGDINWSAMCLWIFITWILIGTQTYNRRVSHIKTREEYKSATGKEIGEEQEQEELDTVSDKLEENQGASSKIQESKEAVEPISFKINETETGYLSPDALQIDGASYIEGMDDYEWIFQIGKKDFEALLKLLKGTNDLSEDVPTELMNYLKENGTKVSEIRDLCKDNDIKHHFENWM